MSTRRALALLFNLVERDDLRLAEQISPSFETTFVGIDGGRGTTYQFTPRREGENITKEADSTIEEAIDSLADHPIDILIVPGGSGALDVLDASALHGLGVLADAAQRVVAFSLGANLIASTGRLDGKKATTHHLWADETFLAQWPNVLWQPKADLVQDGKFVTAYTIPNSKNVAKTAEALLESFGKSLSVEHRIPTTGPLDEVVGTLSLNAPSEWTNLLRRVNTTAQKRVEKSRNEGVDVSADVLESDPYVRAPTTHAAIAAAETRLGVSLPEDYKSFLLTSDGAGFSGTMSIPGMEHVADLEWHDANEMGLGELRMEFTDISDLTEEERTSIPPFDRLLRISDPDDDEIVCLVPPEFVARAYETILSQRGDAIAKPRNEWIVFSFIPWAARYTEYDSVFRFFESKV